MQIRLTDRELDVMSVLWEHGSGTVAEVRGGLPDDLAYTTVLTVLQTLREKGRVRVEDEGKAHRYFPTIEKEQVEQSAVKRLVNTLFEGSPELLLTHLVREQRLSDTELKRLRKLLNDRLKGGPR